MAARNAQVQCQTGRLRTTAVLLSAICLAALAAACGPSPLPGMPGESTPQAQDYYPFTAEGFVIRWDAGSTIELELPNCLAAPVVAGCQPTHIQAVVDGINYWSALHALLGITVNVSTISFSEDVTLIWDDGFGSSGFSIAPGVIGFAAVAEPPAALSRFIVMTTQCNICGSPPPPHSAADIEAIAAHEWGHMLGVWNHSFDPVDLMYPYKAGQTGISKRDALTLLKAYTFPPDLNLSALPPNAWSSPGSLAYTIRFLHQYGAEPSTTLEFNPPEE